ncbi:peptide-N-glycosidase F-related protein [Nonlabens sp. Asnod3-A02]|uniref:peptide-N-glycosidase F-related protein n=1 Tax=Nonlabens sp. Asnod3-A02 TaxID=3160579 RepID=UPI003868AF65
MKTLKTAFNLLSLLTLCFIIINCSGDDDTAGDGTTDSVTLTTSVSQLNFSDTAANETSQDRSFSITGSSLVSQIDLSATGNFEISSDAVNFSSNLSIVPNDVNGSSTIYVKFLPDAIGAFQGVVTIQSADVSTDLQVALSGNGVPVIHNYQTFNRERVAFGGGFSQTSVQSYNLHNDLTNIETIKMYVKLTCPTGGCDEWDVYANVKVTDVASGERYELARFITPYWNDNSQLARGFEFDVTDFKSLLNGNVELRIRTECWNARGYEVSVDFDYIEGTPDYAYYGITRVLNYDNGSAAGVPYGVAHTKDLTRSISVPANAQSTHLRTIISGWGQAASGDADGRTCAEWCFRTHDVLINGANMFQHDLAPLGCASNPVNNQAPGNWMPDRAGWCPGMEVPTRIDNFTSSMAGTTFTFEYDFEDWTNTTTDESFYPISSFVVVKSDTPITRATVID